MNYREVARTDMMDNEEAVLSFIVETNYRSWKFFCRYYPDGLGGLSSDSDGWWFVNQDRALAALREKVQEAHEAGWREQVRMDLKKESE